MKCRYGHVWNAGRQYPGESPQCPECAEHAEELQAFLREAAQQYEIEWGTRIEDIPGRQYDLWRDEFWTEIRAKEGGGK